MQVASAEDFAAKVQDAGGHCELHIYEGAGHAFLNAPDSELPRRYYFILPISDRHAKLWLSHASQSWNSQTVFLRRFCFLKTASRMVLGSLKLCHVVLSFVDVCAEIGQAKASDKDIGLAWERIEAFLWKYVGPESSATSSGNGIGHQQHGEQVPGTATNGTTEVASMNGTSRTSHNDGALNGTDSTGMTHA